MLGFLLLFKKKKELFLFYTSKNPNKHPPENL